MSVAETVGNVTQPLIAYFFGSRTLRTTMSIARVCSFAFSGIEPVPVEVQVQIASGLPAFLVVGLPDISGVCRSYLDREH